MSKKKKILLGVAFILFLVALWLVTYFLWLQVEPKGDNIITAEELAEYDSKDSIFYEATVIVNESEYTLSELNKSVLGDTVIVDVEVNNREVQGYVTYSDTVSKPQVKLADEDTYAQIILPEENMKQSAETTEPSLEQENEEETTNEWE